MTDPQPDPIVTEDSTVIHITYYMMNSLSLIGQLFIIITYLSIRKKSSNFYGYVALHSLIGLPWIITNYLSVYFGQSPSAACEAVAIINTSSYIDSMLWSTVIAWVIYSSLRNQKKITDPRWYHPVIACILGFLFSISTIIYQGYGPYKAIGIQYCWFNNDVGSTVSYWIPFLLTTALDIALYIMSIFIVRKEASKEVSKGFLRLLIFPLIQIICNSGGIVKRIAGYLGDTESPYLEIMHFFLAKGQGLFEALAYGTNQSVRAEIYKVWCKKRAQPAEPNRSLEIPIKHSFSFDEASIEKERSLRKNQIVL